MKKIICSVALCSLLAGCASTGGPRQTGGAVIGAVGGGLLGHQLGKGKGNVAATIAGTAIGALIGSEIGQKYDHEYDYEDERYYKNRRYYDYQSGSRYYYDEAPERSYRVYR